jgi:hypothetical protein
MIVQRINSIIPGRYRKVLIESKKNAVVKSELTIYNPRPRLTGVVYNIGRRRTLF